jgi:hypothetical protein
METTMRKPRDFDAELKALGDKARDLKSRKVQHLGELVIAVGAPILIQKDKPVIVKPSINFLIDGRQLGRVLSESADPYQGFVEQAPAGDGMTQYSSVGDHFNSK